MNIQNVLKTILICFLCGTKHADATDAPVVQQPAATDAPVVPQPAETDATADEAAPEAHVETAAVAE